MFKHLTTQYWGLGFTIKIIDVIFSLTDNV